ncbi:l-lactate dehydrogenase [Diplodia corticola]|uniref:Oxidase FUB9 n=1 Tax=Diplodia corticola TaxID=236234 RepID=A0A1J9QUU0_9PEZI|nr:l-lactate dehydrogenase [Diplodia corticola]OJD32750.1 l-lactate dehydrogenase [Diplodia corticola]
MAPNKPIEHDPNCLNINDLEAIARDKMDKQTRDYYNEGADSNSTLRENVTAYTKYRIRPRVLRDISRIDTTCPVLAPPSPTTSTSTATTTTTPPFRNAIPLGVAPTAMQRLAHPLGEIATARACARAGVAMGLSSFATTSLEDVARAARDECAALGRGACIPLVLQLYLFEERAESERLIERARRAGFAAVFLTVDTPALGRRNGDVRNGFRLPAHLGIMNFAAGDADADAAGGEEEESVAGYWDEGSGRRVRPSGPVRFHTHAANPTLTWAGDVEWLKERCGPEMQVWVKGVATAEDALLAVQYGVDGIVVSNHGGRQLDGALATLDALPEVVAAVKGRIPVHVDGGIRHGTDVFKALALGADFCWIGRPVLWGLAYKGQEGVELCLRLLRDEVKLCMGLAGTVSVKDITSDYLVRMDRDGFPVRLSKL